MMKKIIIFVGFGLLLAGCNLLGNQKPQQSLQLGSGYQTVSDLNQELTGAYSDLQYDATNDRAVGGADWTLLGTIMAGNATYVGSYPTWQQVTQHKMDPNNTSTNGFWIGSYRVINDVNIILSKLNSVTGPKSQAQLDNLKGQCLFIRGSVYFYLVVYYAQPWTGGPNAANTQMGVPLVTKPVTSSTQFTFPERASVDSVYAQIKSDLTQASQLLTANPANFVDGEGNKYAALAMLLRVAMQQQDYTTAATLSQEIMNSGVYNLDPNIKTFFYQKFTPESIWEIANTTQDNPGTNSSLPAIFNPQGRGDIHIAPAYMQAADSVLTTAQKDTIAAHGLTYQDDRISELTETYKGALYTLKYWDYINFSDNAPIFRYAEVILDRAEALARMNGVNQESVNLLNMIRERSIKVYDANNTEVDNKPYVDYTISDFATPQDLINAILLERRVELAFEGERYLDLERLGMSVKGDAFNSPNLQLPIPQQDIDANKNLVQNPAYK